jgi:hypothetical protein
MSSQLIELKDHESKSVQYLDQTTGRTYHDSEGLRLAAEMHPSEYILSEKGQHLRHRDGRLIHVNELANEASDYYHRKLVRLTGKPTKYSLRDDCGRLVMMDLNVGDVHTPATLPNYAAGYRIAEGVADMASPVVQVPKQSDVYYTWNVSTDFNRKTPVTSAPGGGPPEINPTLSPTTYSTIQYAIGGPMPTEIVSNADTPLQPLQKLTQQVVDALLLEREYRVATLLQTGGSWQGSLVTTIASGSQWDGGAASDPIANMHHAQEQSYMPGTAWIFSELLWHDFLRNPAVQKFFGFKDSVSALPDPDEFEKTMKGIPPIYVATMKYQLGGVPTYVWGNSAVLIRQTDALASQIDISTTKTFRWIGGSAPDGSQQAGGFLVRNYFDPKRGARGANVVVAVINDTEAMTSGLVGGLLLSAHQ